MLGTFQLNYYFAWITGVNGDKAFTHPLEKQTPQEVYRAPLKQIEHSGQTVELQLPAHDVMPSGPKRLFPIDLHGERDVFKSVATFFERHNPHKMTYFTIRI